jgi:hypothetical protein
LGHGIDQVSLRRAQVADAVNCGKTASTPFSDEYSENTREKIQASKLECGLLVYLSDILASLANEN